MFNIVVHSSKYPPLIVKKKQFSAKKIRKPGTQQANHTPLNFV